MSRPIVLVHGAWGGAHGFRKVRRLLSAEGREVFSPSLTGIGERSHLTHPGVCLTTHVTDVVNTVLYEDLDDIVLVGFSYGGMVITGALDHIGSRVHDLVYLDAFVPSDGESVRQIVAETLTDPPADWSPIAIGDEWSVPPIPRTLDDPDETAWSNARRSMQPVRTFSEPVKLSKHKEAGDFSLTYIKATADPNEAPDSPFWQAARRAEQSDRWNYHEIATHHLIPSSHPAELATILVELS